MVAPGARLTVGTQENCITCSFQEGGSSAMAEMLLKVGGVWGGQEGREGVGST